MIGAVLQPPLWIELPAVVAGALAGALFAQKRGLDLIGIIPARGSRDDAVRRGR